MTMPSDLEAQHVGTFWLLNLTEAALPEVAARVPVTFQRARSEDTAELAQAMGLDDPDEILRRFAAGKWCYIGRVDGRLATYGWVTFDEEEIGELGLSIRLQPGEAYIWDCGTPPAYRGQRLYPALLSSIITGLRAMGLRRVWIGADADNVASQRGMELAGFRPIADFLLAHAPDRRRAWLRGCPDATTQEVQDIHTAIFGEKREV
jgi:RimJ/RimL family protein N-acetyltransferase